MHELNKDMEVLTQAIIRYAVERVRMDPPTLDAARPESELQAMVGQTITPDGIGGLEALRLFTDVLAPACISVDHPRLLAFVPAAPTEAATLFDLVVSDKNGELIVRHYCALGTEPVFKVRDVSNESLELELDEAMNDLHSEHESFVTQMKWVMRGQDGDSMLFTNSIMLEGQLTENSAMLTRVK